MRELFVIKSQSGTGLIKLPERKRNHYLDLRRRYEPKIIRLVVVAESPPASGLYFYDPAGAPSEPLFAALMKQLRLSPTTKEHGLCGFQRSGWVLVDATYEPVDKLNRSRSRDRIIERDYTLLREHLVALMPDRSIPLILIKENVCRILERKLVEDGFNVLNRGSVIYSIVLSIKNFPIRMNNSISWSQPLLVLGSNRFIVFSIFPIRTVNSVDQTCASTGIGRRVFGVVHSRFQTK